VPSETITEVKRGKKVQTDRKTMPGYVLAKLKLNDDVYHLIKNTPKVTGFLGTMGKPQPITEREAARYFGAREELASQPKREIHVEYEIGDSVKVLDGPSPASTASWKSSISTRTRSRSRSRSSAARPRSSSTSNRSNWRSDVAIPAQLN